MPLVQQLHVETRRPTLHAKETMDQSLPVNKRRARRRWIIRTGLMLSLTAFLLFFFVTWRRDQLGIDASLRSLDLPVTILQNKIDTLGWLPTTLPELGNNYYASDAERYFAMNTTEPVIIATTKPTHLILREDGLCAITYHKGKISSKWIPLSEFRLIWHSQERKMEEFEEKQHSKPPIIP
ncbi:MAG: hypothetical protein JSV03_00150 [Planctomycetota bacterium]|nr:MAG: hypothetical protein JSV03_00150 [Planctomycetota bacterium]